MWLKSGGYIVINQTEALVAIDINTGKYVGKSNRLEDTIVKTNTEAVKEIVRQIRLRDLGGIIVVDFIDMDERKNRQKVMQALEEAMRADRAPYKILQFNDFGLVAITRKRVKQSLERTLCSPCPYCEGAGYVKSVQTVIGEILQEAQKIAQGRGRQGRDAARASGSGEGAEVATRTSICEEIGRDPGPTGAGEERSRCCTTRSSTWRSGTRVEPGQKGRTACWRARLSNTHRAAGLRACGSVRRLALAGGWAEAAPFTHPLPQSLTVIGRQRLPGFAHTAAELGPAETAPPTPPNRIRQSTRIPSASQNVIWRQPNSEGSSQFHSCSTIPPPMAIKASTPKIASGATTINRFLMFGPYGFRNSS